MSLSRAVRRFREARRRTEKADNWRALVGYVERLEAVEAACREAVERHEVTEELGEALAEVVRWRRGHP